MTNRLFVLAHPDDEMLCLPYVLDRRVGTDYFLYLSFNSVSPIRRVEANRAITFLNREVGDTRLVKFNAVLRDGRLWEDLGRDDIRLLVQTLEALKIDLVISFAYEGGHQDHDIANALSRLLQKSFQVNFIQFSGYRKHNHLPIFVLGNPIERGEKISFPRVRAAKIFLRLALIHKSQFKVWLIFSPSILIRLLLLKSFEAISTADSSLLKKSSYLYEIRGKASRNVVESAALEIARLEKVDWDD